MARTRENDAAGWLREHGLRATQGRIAIVRLLQSSKVPLTLSEIHEKLEKACGCDFATVFRFVSLLEEKNLVERVAWMDGTTRHEMRDDSHHHHPLSDLPDLSQGGAAGRVRDGAVRGPDRERAGLRGNQPFAAAFGGVPGVPAAGGEEGTKVSGAHGPAFARRARA